MRLDDFIVQVDRWMVASEFKNRRSIYKNENILVTQNLETFSNGSREAIL